MKIKILLAVLFLAAGAFTTSAQERIKFKKGEYFTNIEGGVPRGEIYSYLVGASKGQFMTTDNWQYMSGATEDNPTTRWEGTLPMNGDYEIVVGSTRGGAEYTLQVVIE